MATSDLGIPTGIQEEMMAVLTPEEVKAKVAGKEKVCPVCGGTKLDKTHPKVTRPCGPCASGSM